MLVYLEAYVVLYEVWPSMCHTHTKHTKHLAVSLTTPFLFRLLPFRSFFFSMRFLSLSLNSIGHLYLLEVNFSLITCGPLRVLAFSALGQQLGTAFGLLWQLGQFHQVENDLLMYVFFFFIYHIISTRQYTV